MKILVFGAGVLGCSLARDLFRGGKDVTLLARGAWGQEIQKNGLRIKSALFPHTTVSRIPVTGALTPEDDYDAVFVAVRCTQIQGALDTLRACKARYILFLGNNVRAPEVAAQLPGKTVLFAFASSAGHREKNRVVSADMRKITVGPLRGAASAEALIEELFRGTGYRVCYEPNMGDYLLSHAAFVLPAVFACYRTDGDLKKLRHNDAYLNKLIDATVEGYRAILRAGHEVRPKEDRAFETPAFRKTCFRFYKLLCWTVLGKICVSDHAMNAVDEMRALNRDMNAFLDRAGGQYPTWQALEKECGKYLK